MALWHSIEKMPNKLHNIERVLSLCFSRNVYHKILVSNERSRTETEIVHVKKTFHHKTVFHGNSITIKLHHDAATASINMSDLSVLQQYPAGFPLNVHAPFTLMIFTTICINTSHLEKATYRNPSYIMSDMLFKNNNSLNDLFC